MMKPVLSIGEIYDEYIRIVDIIDPSEYKLVETEKMLQIELECPANDVEKLIQLNTCDYFEVLVKGTSYDLNYYINDDGLSLKEGASSTLDGKIIRITYNKVELMHALKNIDYFFFFQQEASDFILQCKKAPTEFKLNIGIYNISPFETNILNFINISDIEQNSSEKIPITKEIKHKIDIFLNHTDMKFNKLNNIYTYMPLNDKFDSSNILQYNILKNFFICFYKCLSYKNSESTFNIRGKKSITITIKDSIISNNYTSYKKIVDFLFSDDKFLEKFIIVKNVFTRYATNVESFETLDQKIIEIQKTINHYFEKYVHDDLDSFFINRDTVYKEAISMSKLINEQNDKIVAYINTTLISILALGITFTYKNITDLNLNLLIVSAIILLFFSIMFYRIIYNNSISRSKSIEEQFDMFLNKMGIILEDEKIEIKEIYICKPKNNLMTALNRIKSILIFANTMLIMFILFSIFNIVKII